MATVCSPSQGHPETYGLGIRLVFYIFWYTIISSQWIAPSETRNLRFIHTTLTLGFFVGLLSQVDRNILTTAEIYVGILLVLGSYLYYIPLYIWRTLTWFRDIYDPERFLLVEEGPIYAICNFVLLLAIVVFKLWFWVGVAGDSAAVESNVQRSSSDCQQFGFFFSRVRLDGSSFVVGNIMIAVLLLLGCVLVGLGACFKMRRTGWVREVIDDDGRSISETSTEYDERVNVDELRRTALQEWLTFIHLLAISTVVAAVELTISWNAITGVNSLASPSQSLPFVLGVIALVRVLYIATCGNVDERYRIKRARSVEWAGVRRFFGVGSRKRRRRSKSRRSRGSGTSSSRT